MKKIVLFLFIFSSLLTGCQTELEELSIKEVEMKSISTRAKEYFEGIEIHHDDTSTGIYLFRDSENKNYLYLNQDFLDEGRDFGDVEISDDKDFLTIYLSDIDGNNQLMEQYKVYEIKRYETYEFLRVFKNDKDTYFQGSGI